MYCCFFSRIRQVLSCKIFLYNLLTVYLSASLSRSLLSPLSISLCLSYSLSFSLSLSFLSLSLSLILPPLSLLSLPVSLSRFLLFLSRSLSLPLYPSLPRSPSLFLSLSLSCALSFSFSLFIPVSLPAYRNMRMCVCTCVFSLIFAQNAVDTKRIDYKVCVFVFIYMYVCVCTHMCTCVCGTIYILCMKYIHLIFEYACIHDFYKSYSNHNLPCILVCLYTHTCVRWCACTFNIFTHKYTHLSVYTCSFISSTHITVVSVYIAIHQSIDAEALHSCLLSIIS